MEKETEIRKLADDELEGVAGGQKLCHIVKNEKGKYNVFAGEWAGDVKGFLSLFQGAELKQCCASIGVEGVKGVRPDKIDRIKANYIGQGYTLV